mmetsp:Transcript_69933/g.169260  ORF Transcript_69933/g.169260 Transcript_69933/m.169260 type:complete len:281 (-) Transcript_69933:445-1287(-)
MTLIQARRRRALSALLAFRLPDGCRIERRPDFLASAAGGGEGTAVQDRQRLWLIGLDLHASLALRAGCWGHPPRNAAWPDGWPRRRGCRFALVRWLPTELAQLPQAVCVHAVPPERAPLATKHIGAELCALQVWPCAKLLAAVSKPARPAPPAATAIIESAKPCLVEDGLLLGGFVMIPSFRRRWSTLAVVRGSGGCPITLTCLLATAASHLAPKADPGLAGGCSTESRSPVAADLRGARRAEHTSDRCITYGLLSPLTTEHACGLAAGALGSPNKVALS